MHRVFSGLWFPIGDLLPIVEHSLTVWQPGDRVVLVGTNDPYTELEPGDEGIVSDYAPIICELLVDWDRGARQIMLPDAGDIIERV